MRIGDLIGNEVPVNVEYLVPGGQQLLSLNGEVKASHFWKEKVKNTIEIVTSKGYSIEGTPDHPVLVWDENCRTVFKKLKDIHEGDYVVLKSGWKVGSSKYVSLAKHKSNLRQGRSVNLPDVLDERFASFLGVFLADGNCIENNGVVVSSRRRFVRNIVENFASSIGANVSRSDYRMTINSSRLSRFISSIFENKTVARSKIIPKEIFESPLSVQRAFLKAYTSCDGYFQSSLAEICTASKEAKYGLINLLLNFGIFCTVREKNGAFDGVNYQDWTYYRLFITGEDYKRFIEEIGSYKSAKAKFGRHEYSVPYLAYYAKKCLASMRQAVGWSRNGTTAAGIRFPRYKFTPRSIYEGFMTPLEARRFLETFAEFDFDDRPFRMAVDPTILIDKIEEKYEKEHEKPITVYDVHVPNTHSFCSNGFISHNTLLAIEGSANFLRKYPQGQVWYCETEAAFDPEYAEALGLDMDKVNFLDDIHTVEALYESFEELLKEMENAGEGQKALYIIDSLDALSDMAELERKMTDGSYGTSKARKISELLRRMNAQLHKSNVTVMTISQTRENIGVSFGEKYTRSGGRAIRFYASQELWLALVGKIEKTSKGIKRTTGVKVRAKVKKNKCGLPHRECDFNILFGYGIDDLSANLQWLESAGELERHFGEKAAKSVLKAAEKLSDDEFNQLREKAASAVWESWREVESRFLPNRRKY